MSEVRRTNARWNGKCACGQPVAAGAEIAYDKQAVGNKIVGCAGCGFGGSAGAGLRRGAGPVHQGAPGRLAAVYGHTQLNPHYTPAAAAQQEVRRREALARSNADNQRMPLRASRNQPFSTRGPEYENTTTGRRATVVATSPLALSSGTASRAAHRRVAEPGVRPYLPGTSSGDRLSPEDAQKLADIFNAPRSKKKR